VVEECTGNASMFHQDEERLRELAKMAIDEKDEDKFLGIIQELNTLLETKLHDLRAKNLPFQRPKGHKEKPSGVTRRP
jgi:hypothetical protein